MLLKVEDDSSQSSDSDDDFDQFCINGRCDWSPASAGSESELATSWTSGLSPQSSPRSQVFGESKMAVDKNILTETSTVTFPFVFPQSYPNRIRTTTPPFAAKSICPISPSKWGTRMMTTFSDTNRKSVRKKTSLTDRHLVPANRVTSVRC